MIEHWKPLQERMVLNKLQTDALYALAGAVGWTVGEVIDDMMLWWASSRIEKKMREACGAYKVFKRETFGKEKD